MHRSTETALYPVLKRFEEMAVYFDNLMCGIMIIEGDTRKIVYVNQVMCEIMKCGREMLIGRQCHNFICPSGQNACPILDLSQKVDQSERILLTLEGLSIPILKSVRRFEENGKTYLLESFSDIRKQKSHEDELIRMSGLDRLTGLPNRVLLDARIKAEFNRPRRESTRGSLLLMDIDRFKLVNDNYGHSKGDQVLQELSAYLTGQIRVEDSVYRWGGEEFLIYAENLCIHEAVQLAERLRENISALAMPIPRNVTVSLGVAEYQPGESFDHWFNRTDFCLLKAKREGRNQTVSWGGPSPHNAGNRKLRWLSIWKTPDKEEQVLREVLVQTGTAFCDALANDRCSNEQQSCFKALCRAMERMDDYEIAHYSHSTRGKGFRKNHHDHRMEELCCKWAGYLSGTLHLDQLMEYIRLEVVTHRLTAGSSDSEATYPDILG